MNSKASYGLFGIQWSQWWTLWHPGIYISLIAGGRAAEGAENQKYHKYQGLIDEGYTFRPVAFETYGRLGPDTSDFLQEIGSGLHIVTQESRSHRFLLQRLAISILIGNAVSILGTAAVASSLGLLEFLSSSRSSKNLAVHLRLSVVHMDGLGASFEGEGCLEDDLDDSFIGDAPDSSKWYHGLLDRLQAEEQLLSHAKGSYLIRESYRKPGSYGLSFVSAHQGICHFRITAMCGDYWLGTKKFPSLPNLVAYYNVKNVLKDEPLLHPVPPSASLVEDATESVHMICAILPYRPLPDTDELELEKGDLLEIIHYYPDSLWCNNTRTEKSGVVYHQLIEPVDSENKSYETRDWFHSRATRQEINERLSTSATGTFVITTSESQVGNFTLYVRLRDCIHKFKVENLLKHRKFLMGGRNYSSLDDIVKHYTKEKIYEDSFLCYPLDKPAYDEFVFSDKVFKSLHNRSHLVGTSLISGNDDSCSGYLSKLKDGRKWKIYYIQVYMKEQHLYIVENEKRTKPKLFLDLALCQVYEVDPSLFDRPYCFQLRFSNLNDSNVFHFSAESQDSMEKWLQAISYGCRRHNEDEPEMRYFQDLPRQRRSLQLEIVECKNIPAKVPHPYCQVFLNDVGWCKTRCIDPSVDQESCMIWNASFSLDNLPTEFDSVTVKLCNKNKRSRDTEVCSLKLPFSQMLCNRLVDQWYPLMMSNQSKGSPGHPGSIRMKSLLRKEVILKYCRYQRLEELILHKDLTLLRALGKACNADLSRLATSLLNIYEQKDAALVMLEALLADEIHRAPDSKTLFRITSLATTLLEKYMRRHCASLVYKCLQPSVAKILELRHCLELNPSLVDKQTDIDPNVTQLTCHLTEITEKIIDNRGLCPKGLKYIFYRLQQCSRQKWPFDVTIHVQCVTSFLFLRLFVPAILSPRNFNLTDEPTMSATQKRTFKIVAKSIQNLANLVEFGCKEPYMDRVNPFIRQYRERLVRYVDQLCSDSLSEDWWLGNDRPKSDWDYSGTMATLHQICMVHIDELQTASRTKVEVKKLLGVLEDIVNKQKEVLS